LKRRVRLLEQENEMLPRASAYRRHPPPNRAASGQTGSRSMKVQASP